MKKEISMPLFWTKWRGVDYPPLGLVTVILLCSNLCAGSIGINIYIYTYCKYDGYGVKY